MRFKSAILSLLAANFVTGGANAVEQTVWPIKLVSFRLFNSPILGSPSYYFLDQYGSTIEITCSKNIWLQPIMLVRIAPQENTPSAAIMNVESIGSCIGKVQPVAEAVRAGTQYTVKLSQDDGERYQSVEFSK